MMRYFFFLLMFAACNQSPKVKSVQEFSDSLRIAREADSITDAIVKDVRYNIYFDTVGVADGPVQVTGVRVTQEEYSRYKDVRLTYKNVSGKNISAIRFRWYGENAFGEPADMTSLQDGFGGGYTDDLLRAGKSSSGEWDVNSRDLKKVLHAWAYEVVFEDGTKWKSTSKER